MFQTIKPKLDKLPAAQRELWAELGQVGPRFVLYGGTAISVRLAHRESVDFDFFSSQLLDPDKLLRAVPFLRGAAPIQAEPNTLTCEVDRGGPVKISFFGGLDLKRVEDPDRCPDNGLFVASLLDLAATKLKALWQRAVYKDYFDLDVLLQQGIDLAAALSAARAVYGSGFNPLISLKALAYFEEGDVARLASDAKERLHRAVRGVNLTQLTERSGPFKRLDEGLWS
ncbi:MAG: hypothetical protein A2992_00250 [Elusimicrobia bacterium RIFCSPLOWO2_01_FULL_59_12]|nr:MAG: hypothetical protein A2992_00250 [Elusimicrobia bacterium RIFCSPLOWO2_01_FULL_59_12]